jgi:hypothetical protein
VVAHRRPASRAEIVAPAPVEPLAEIPFVIERRRRPLEVVNRLRQAGPYS